MDRHKFATGLLILFISMALEIFLFYHYQDQEERAENIRDISYETEQEQLKKRQDQALTQKLTTIIKNGDEKDFGDSLITLQTKSNDGATPFHLCHLIMKKVIVTRSGFDYFKWSKQFCQRLSPHYYINCSGNQRRVSCPDEWISESYRCDGKQVISKGKYHPFYTQCALNFDMFRQLHLEQTGAKRYQSGALVGFFDSKEAFLKALQKHKSCHWLFDPKYRQGGAWSKPLNHDRCKIGR